MKTQVTIRPAELTDLAGVVDLLNREAIAITGEPELDEPELKREWTGPGTEISRDMRVAIADDGSYVGYVEYANNRDPHVRPFTYCCVDPEADQWNWNELLQWAEQRARDDIKRAPAGARFTLSSGSFAEDARVIEAWRAAGFQETRRFYEMRIEFHTTPDPAIVPAGYTIRPMRGDEERIVYDAMQEAFADHYGFARPTDPEAGFMRWKHYLLEGDDADREMLLIAMAPDAEVAGGSLCRPSHGGDPDLGWVNSLAVSRGHRQKGLGEALLRRSFEVFYRKGKKRAGLGVDAQSLTNATRLYRKCGMKEQKVFVNLSKVLRDGKELANIGE